MARVVALLRGINVGGNKRVPMAELRALLEGLGHTAVVTLLQSGNVALTSRERHPARLRARLEEAIEERFGFPVAVVLRTRDELAAAVAANPLRVDDPTRFLVTFFADRPDPAKLGALENADWRPAELRVVGREIYARLPDGVGRSKLATVLLGTRLGVATARNWSTVTKLLALAGADD